MDPKGKIALVTGGASGIGLAITKELLREGVQGISVCDVNIQKGHEEVHKLQNEYGKEKLMFIKTDVTNDDEFEDAFKKTIQHFGGLDIVVNNAGIGCDRKWKLEVSVNVNGAIQGALLALKYLGKDQKGKGGVLVNTGSIAGLGQGMNVQVLYNATKHAVIGLSRSLGDDFYLKTTGVRVVCVCPGYTATEIVNEADLDSSVTYREDWFPVFKEGLERYKPAQSAQNVGLAVIHMIRNGASGSLWVSENDKPAYEIKIPHHEQLKVK